MKSVLTLFLPFLLMQSLSLSAQEAALPAGGDMNNNAASVSYSIGQTFFTPILGNSSQMALQGVQQPFEWFEIETSLPQVHSGVSIQLFPNPSVDFVYLEQSEGHKENYHGQLYDGSGKIVKELNIASQREVMSLGQLPKGLYYLKITNKDQPSQFQTFRIVKN